VPKSIAATNAVLLLSLSALAGLGLPVLLGREQPLASDAHIMWLSAFIALLTGFIMLVTELFSGHRFIAVIAFAGVAVGVTSMWRSGVGSEMTEWAWIVGLLAVVLWFTVLASAGRANR
jgi:hypothetical protein